VRTASVDLIQDKQRLRGEASILLVSDSQCDLNFFPDFRVSVILLILILLGAFSIRFLGADSREQTRRPLDAHKSIWQ
jgi:hypothetical protein